MELLKKYVEAEKAFYGYFKYDGLSHGIEDHTDKFWQVGEHSVYWSDQNPVIEKLDEWPYSEDLKGTYRGPDFTLVLIRSMVAAFGTYLIVLSNDKELPDWEPEWE